MNRSRTALRARLPRVGLSAAAVLLGLVAQTLALGHVLFEHAGAHAHHGHAHEHHDGHDHHGDHRHGGCDAPLPTDGVTAHAPSDAHGCADDCPVQDVPLRLTPAGLAPLHASTAPTWSAPRVADEHLVAHRAVPLRALAPKTSPPIA